MSKHTPGKWEYISATPYVVTDYDRIVASVHHYDKDGAVGSANGRLIAASPRMLELLREVIATEIELIPTVRFKEWYSLCEKIDDLLKEVEGG
jgi:hypothetical protein